MFLVKALLWAQGDLDEATAQSCSPLNQYLSVGVVATSTALTVAFTCSLVSLWDQMNKVNEGDSQVQFRAKVAMYVLAFLSVVATVLAVLQPPSPCAYKNHGYLAWNFCTPWHPVLLILVVLYTAAPILGFTLAPRPLGYLFLIGALCTNLVLSYISYNERFMTKFVGFYLRMWFGTSLFLPDEPYDTYTEVHDIISNRVALIMCLFVLALPPVFDFVGSRQLDQKSPFAKWFFKGIPSFLKADQALGSSEGEYKEGAPLLGSK